MEFLPYSLKWLELTLRWGHVLFAILWVGNSFLFNYLDNKLNKKISSRAIDGEGYLMHSGYYYKLTRLKVSPPKNYLRSLTIFKWQSYLTFITGILLLGVIYYYKSGILMVDKKVLEILKPIINEVLILNVDDNRIVEKELLIKTCNNLSLNVCDYEKTNENKEYLVFGSFSVVETFLKGQN